MSRGKSGAENTPPEFVNVISLTISGVFQLSQLGKDQVSALETQRQSSSGGPRASKPRGTNAPQTFDTVLKSPFVEIQFPAVAGLPSLPHHQRYALSSSSDSQTPGQFSLSVPPVVLPLSSDTPLDALSVFLSSAIVFSFYSSEAGDAKTGAPTAATSNTTRGAKQSAAAAPGKKGREKGGDSQSANTLLGAVAIPIGALVLQRASASGPLTSSLTWGSAPLEQCVAVPCDRAGSIAFEESPPRGFSWLHVGAQCAQPLLPPGSAAVSFSPAVGAGPAPAGAGLLGITVKLNVPWGQTMLFGGHSACLPQKGESDLLPSAARVSPMVGVFVLPNVASCAASAYQAMVAMQHLLSGTGPILFGNHELRRSPVGATVVVEALELPSVTSSSGSGGGPLQLLFPFGAPPAYSGDSAATVQPPSTRAVGANRSVVQGSPVVVELPSSAIVVGVGSALLDCLMPTSYHGGIPPSRNAAIEVIMTGVRGVHSPWTKALASRDLYLHVALHGTLPQIVFVNPTAFSGDAPAPAVDTKVAPTTVSPSKELRKPFTTAPSFNVLSITRPSSQDPKQSLKLAALPAQLHFFNSSLGLYTIGHPCENRPNVVEQASSAALPAAEGGSLVPNPWLLDPALTVSYPAGTLSRSIIVLHRRLPGSVFRNLLEVITSVPAEVGFAAKSALAGKKPPVRSSRTPEGGSRNREWKSRAQLAVAPSKDAAQPTEPPSTSPTEPPIICVAVANTVSGFEIIDQDIRLFVIEALPAVLSEVKKFCETYSDWVINAAHGGPDSPVLSRLYGDRLSAVMEPYKSAAPVSTTVADHSQDVPVRESSSRRQVRRPPSLGSSEVAVPEPVDPEPVVRDADFAESGGLGHRLQRIKIQGKLEDHALRTSSLAQIAPETSSGSTSYQVFRASLPALCCSGSQRLIELGRVTSVKSALTRGLFPTTTELYAMDFHVGLDLAPEDVTGDPNKLLVQTANGPTQIQFNPIVLPKGQEFPPPGSIFESNAVANQNFYVPPSAPPISAQQLKKIEEVEDAVNLKIQSYPHPAESMLRDAQGAPLESLSALKACNGIFLRVCGHRATDEQRAAFNKMRKDAGVTLPPNLLKMGFDEQLIFLRAPVDAVIAILLTKEVARSGGVRKSDNVLLIRAFGTLTVIGDALFLVASEAIQGPKSFLTRFHNSAWEQEWRRKAQLRTLASSKGYKALRNSMRKKIVSHVHINSGGGYGSDSESSVINGPPDYADEHSYQTMDLPDFQGAVHKRIELAEADGRAKLQKLAAQGRLYLPPLDTLEEDSLPQQQPVYEDSRPRFNLAVHHTSRIPDTVFVTSQGQWSPPAATSLQTERSQSVIPGKPRFCMPKSRPDPPPRPLIAGEYSAAQLDHMHKKEQISRVHQTVHKKEPMSLKTHMKGNGIPRGKCRSSLNTLGEIGATNRASASLSMFKPMTDQEKTIYLSSVAKQPTTFYYNSPSSLSEDLSVSRRSHQPRAGRYDGN